MSLWRKRLELGVLIATAAGIVVSAYSMTAPLISYQIISEPVWASEYNAQVSITLTNEGLRDTTEVRITVTLGDGYFTEEGRAEFPDYENFSQPIPNCIPTEDHACVAVEPYIVVFSKTIVMYFPLFPAGKTKEFSTTAMSGWRTLELVGESGDGPVLEKTSGLQEKIMKDRVLLGASAMGFVVAFFSNRDTKRKSKTHKGKVSK